jgi:hypothetical protein
VKTKRAGWGERLVALAAAVGLAAPFVADEAAAQSRMEFSVIPHATAVIPAGDFGRIAETAPGAGTYAAVVGGLPSAPALGLTAELRLGNTPLTLRASGLWSFEGDGIVTLDCADQACPALLVRREMETRVWAVVGGVALRPEVSVWSISPHVALGGGVRGRSFQWSGDPLVFPPGDVDLRNGVLHASAGLARPVGPGAVVLEVGDLVGRVGDASDEYRHDVTISLGYRM